MAIIIPSTGAHAASGLTLTPPGTIQGNTAEDCYDATYGYALALDPAVAGWTLDVAVTRPDGSREGGDFFTDSDMPSGTGTELLCPYVDSYGTYTITATLTTRDASYNTLEVIPTAVTFKYAGPIHSVTTLTLSAHRLYPGHPVTMRIRAMRAGTGWRNVKVRIEMKAYGIWNKVTTGRTSPTGRLRFKMTPKQNVLNDPAIGGHTFRFRAVTRDTAFIYGDTSPSTRLHFG